MAKSVFTDAYTSFRETLVELRTSRGITQVELAARLGKPQQWVSRIELGIRRIDVVKFYAIAHAIGVEPASAFTEVTKAFPVDVAI